MKEFCTIKVRRAKCGVKIYCKSEAIEELFRCISESERNIDQKITGEYWEGIEGYKIHSLPFKLNNGYFLKWGDTLIVNDKANLSFLRAVGLSGGVEFVVKEPYTKQELQEWIEKAEVALRELQEQLFSTVDFEIAV